MEFCTVKVSLVLSVIVLIKVIALWMKNLNHGGDYLDDFCLLFIIYINHFTFDVIQEHPAGHVVKFWLVLYILYYILWLYELHSHIVVSTSWDQTDSWINFIII